MQWQSLSRTLCFGWLKGSDQNNVQVIDCGSQYTAKIYEFLQRHGHKVKTSDDETLGYIISGL